MPEQQRPLVWIGRSQKDFSRLPADVQDAFLKSLRLARAGAREIPGAKPLSRGILKGLGVIELIEDFEHDTYRAVYTAKIGSVLAVLHVFKKKSTSGISTPLPQIRLIRDRYRTAVRLHSNKPRRHGR